MTLLLTHTFNDPQIGDVLSQSTVDELDSHEFGVIGFDAEGAVRRYNTFESNFAGLSVERVMGHLLFTEVAPCMNNYLVAQRFVDAAADATELDATIDYVLTLRMRPVKVKLRLIAKPGAPLRFVLVQRS